jgi:hypothetical protein
MCGCVQTVGGTPGPAPAALCGSPICIDESTLGAETVAIPIGTLGVVGAAITFRIRLDGQQTNGQRGLYFAPEGNAARNSIGSNLATPIFIGPVGYIDTVLVPWSTIIVPAGWGVALGIAASVLTLSFNGALGQPAHWRGMIERWAHNGAVLA